MFWMVALYATLQEGTILDERAFTTDLQKMIKKSDNEAASRVLDQISDAESGSELEAENYQAWLNKRKQVNKFFLDAGYQDINVSQKTFPIPYLNLYEPKGRDLQMRGDPNQPIRNKITTHHAARLLYEIMAGQAVSPEYSQQMINLLTIDPATRIQKRNLQDPNQFNPVRGFFSQSLPDDIYFAAKAGWTSGSRQEAAYIATQDGRTAYILVIFAEDRSYAYDWKIFPKLSRHVFNRMTERAVVQ
jgi:beta-lactamase class A